MNVLSHAPQRLLDLMYPRTCCCCGNPVETEDENGLCWDCRADSVPLGPPWCRMCGQGVAGRIDHEFTCADCAEDPPVYQKGRSLFRYEGGVREAIHALKYRQDFSVVPDLSRLLLAGLHAHFPELENPVLVAVPLHPRRKRIRGFNQGSELIRSMRKLEPELDVWKGLRRIKNTDTQTRLSKAARKKNVQGAFQVRSRIAVPDRLILIDDVMTTGATLNSCARALKKAGAKEIHTLTLARG